jgi:hypothetical protein
LRAVAGCGTLWVVDSNRFPPGFAASLVGATAGVLGGAFLVGLLAWPFALASWSTLAVGGGDGTDAAQRFLVVAVLLLLVQLLVSAWIAQHAAALVGDGVVGYGRALGALALGAVGTILAAATFPDGASLPLLGHSWVGLLLAAWVISSGPRVSETR